MEEKTYDEDKCIINIRLMKIINMYEIFDPKLIKLNGYNIYRIVNNILLSINVITIFLCGWSAYCFLNDYYNMVNYTMMGIVISYTTYRTYYIIQHSDAIWNCIEFTSVDFLSSYCYKKDKLLAGRTACIKLTYFFALLWGYACIIWMITPFVMEKVNRGQADSNGTDTKYRMNVFNFLFPVSVEFYNNNFIVFYVIEVFIMTYNSFYLIMFDIIIIPFCMAICVQLDTVAMAYESSGQSDFICEDNDERNTKHESNPIENLKSVIQDHQRVIKEIREIYKIFGPIILLLIAVESNVIVFQAFILIVGFMDGVSFTTPVMLNLLVAVFVYIFHLFVVCFLFNEINVHKSNVNYALFSSDWTEMGIPFKKLVLCAMRINNADKFILKVTSKRIVNLEMFASVMHLCYSIISVMVKSKQKLAVE